MAATSDFQIDRRVGIAWDALSPSQRAALKPLLQTKKSFVTHAKRAGATEKLHTAKPLYSMKVRGGIRIIFSMDDDQIIVQDIIRKATMDHFATKRSGAVPAVKKRIGKPSVK